MSGYQIRLGKLFNSTSGRSFVTALDHAVTLGPTPGNIDARTTLATAIAGGPEAVLIGPGLLDKCGDLFADRNAPAPILRCDYLNNHPYMSPLGEGYQRICSAEHAVRLGAEAVVLFLMVGTDNLGMWKENVATITSMVESAHNVGLPVIVESVLWGTRVSEQKDPEMLAFGARTAAELGADIVKTEYSGDAGTMKDIVNGCPVPVLVLGGSKTNNPEALWQGTRDAIAAGAKGVIYGRNVWQSDDPIGVSRLLRDIIHGTPA